MSSENDQNLTVDNGFPIAGFDQGRNGGTPDLDEVKQRWFDLGMELASESGVGVEYTILFNGYYSTGNHPEICYQKSLDDLGIEWQSDTFFVTDKNETIEI